MIHLGKIVVAIVLGGMLLLLLMIAGAYILDWFFPRDNTFSLPLRSEEPFDWKDLRSILRRRD